MAISRAQLAKELEPGLNALFGLEYARYDDEAREVFEIIDILACCSTSGRYWRMFGS